MSPDAGWEVIRAAFRCSRELQALLPGLKTDCGPDEYKMFLAGIARAVDTVNVELIDRALEKHPQLKSRIEETLDRDGHIS